MNHDLMLDTLQAMPFCHWSTYDPTLQVANQSPLDTIVPWLQPWTAHTTAEGVDTIWRTSMFVGHQYEPSHTALASHPFGWQPVWLFVVLLLLTTLTLTYFISRNIKMPLLLRSAIDRRALDRLVRDCNLGRPMLMVSMGLLYCAALGTSVWLFAIHHTGVVGWLLLVVALGVAYLLRSGVLRLLGTVFDSSAAIATYITTGYLYHLIATTALLPLLYLQAYLPGAGHAVGIVVMGVAAVTFLARFARGVKLFLTSAKNSGFYLFYYLCTVEIVPFLILIKWIIVDQPGS